VQFFWSFVYICITIGDQLSRGEGWDPINRFNNTTFFCPSKAGMWISNIMVVYYVFREWRWEVIVLFVDISGIVDQHCLNFIIITCNFKGDKHLVLKGRAVISSQYLLSIPMSCYYWEFIVIVFILSQSHGQIFCPNKKTSSGFSTYLRELINWHASM